MSFILDALRKSEHERQRQAGPPLAEIPLVRPPASRLPAAGIAIGVLVLVNVGVLAYFLLRSPSPATPPAASAPSSAQSSAATPAMPPPASMPPASTTPAASPTARELRPLAGEASPTYDQPPPPQYTAPGPPDPALLPPVRPAQSPAAHRSPAATAAGDEQIPTINDLTPHATAGLPALNLDLHVYATSAAQRFVFINNHRYLEGNTTPEGVIVERITPDGVILSWRGMRFLLPRQ